MPGEKIADAIHGLRPRDDSQRALLSRSEALSETVLQARWLAGAANTQSVHQAFLVVILFWLTITFASFGLFSPRNTLVVAVLLICTLSVGGAVFLVLEMDGPFDGLI